jgi:hypothetical protein
LQSKKNTVPEKSQEKEISPKITDTVVREKVVSHESETIKKGALTSKLEEKVTRLSQLEHNYQLKSLEVVPPEKTLLLGRLQRILKRKDSLAKKIKLSAIKSGIHEIRKSFLKGTKPMQPNGNTFSRVTIEEYIFKTTESATTAFETLINTKKNGGLWMYISKAPYELFIEENNIYFMSSGGFYMMAIYEDIFEKIKDQSIIDN